MERFHLRVGTLSCDGVKSRAMVSLRIYSSQSGIGRSTPLLQTSIRLYGSGPYQQQPGPGGYPQQMMNGGYPQQQQQYAPYPYPYPPPPPPPAQNFGQSDGSAEIGTKDRPLFVVSAPTKPSLMSLLWFFLILVIGATQLLHLMEEIDWRTSGDNSGKPGVGGQSRALANMFGSHEVQPVNLDEQTTTFDDIQGVDEAKQELQEIVQFLKDPKKFIEIGGRLPRGALLVGPPGCGKTMLAKAIAKEANVKFYYASGSEFDEMFVGVGARRVRDLFAEAKKNAPALIFIDEIDSLGAKRSNRDAAYSRMTLNQLLAEMDGFKSGDEVVVLGATNTPETLDKALIRPGRFDTQISVDPPDLKGREAITETYLAKIKKDATVKAIDIARGTAGFTGAELRNLVNVAAIRAAVLNKKEVSVDEIEYAKDRVMMGAENRSKVIPDEEKKITAFHEGGHALAALLLESQGAEPVHKATIVPRGSGIMGLVQQQPNVDRYSQSKKQLLSRMKVALAGRAAEEILLGCDDVTTGASSDFQQATNIARTMVRRFGFNASLGTIDYESADTHEGAYMSDGTKEKIETEVRKVMAESYKETMEMLCTHRDALDRIAKNLLEHETLSGDQLKRILAGESIGPPKPKPQLPPLKPKNSGGGGLVQAIPQSAPTMPANQKKAGATTNTGDAI